MRTATQFVGKVGLLGLSISFQACSVTAPNGASSQAAVASIRTVLITQTAAWNRGDIPGFMQGYWKSDSLVFIGRKGPTYGWQQTLAIYQKSYPDAATMGQLDFSGLRISLLGPNAAQVIGRWHLARPSVGDVQGHFLLVMRQINGQWVVAADHTTSQ